MLFSAGYNIGIMFSRLSLFTLAILQASTVLTHAAAPDVVTYEKDVRPILKAHCFHCHGESAELSGELDLRLTRLMIRGGESGPAITAGKPAESLMVEYLTDGLMPPEEVENRPTDRQIETIIQWIAQGAPTEQAEPESLGNGFYISEQERSFWSFRPIVRPSLPKISQTTVVENGIDFFIAAKLEDHDLTFSPAAEDSVLIRRVYLDLLGLPPTLAALRTYTPEKQPDVYDKLVDQLLASPAYGQRWGRHWLDAAGYADSKGYTDADAERPWAFKYRDYVIDSFNRDKPYDQFIVEQLAGDELLEKEFVNLSQREREPLIATGFLRNAPDGTGSGAATDVARNAVVSETIKLVTSSLVGLTVGCAQCHHHRYDPISQEDYYRLRAIFEPAYNWKAWRTPAQRQITLYTDADRARKAEVEAKVKVIAAERATKQQEYITATFEKEIAKLPAEIREDVRGAHDVNEKDRIKKH